jgi:hypothetical protein
MVERMIKSISSASNMHGVVDDNSNPYRNMIMDAIRMNQGYWGEYLIIDEEPNINTTKFFDLLKDFNEQLWNRCTNHSKLSVNA